MADGKNLFKNKRPDQTICTSNKYNHYKVLFNKGKPFNF